MLDISLEIARALAATAIFAYVVVAGRRHGLYGQRGWRHIVTGFGLILLGCLLDITDNFPALNVFVVIGDTPVEAVLERIFAYLLGFVLVFTGLWYWIPLVGGLSGETRRLTGYAKDLEAQVSQRTSDLEKAVEQAREECAGMPIFGEAGDFQGYRGTATDVTRAKREERDLEELEIRARAIVDGVFDAVITMDEDGIIDTFNPGAQRCFGYRPDEVVGQNVKMLMPESYRSEHDTYLRNFLEFGRAKVIGIGREFEGQRKDGSRFPIELAVTQTWISGAQMFTGIVRDISERKRVDRIQSEFISMVSHELRTPLTSIQGSLGLITGGFVGELPEKVDEMVKIAYNNSNRLVRLVNDILDIEKIAAGMMNLNSRPLKLLPLLQQAIDAPRGFADLLEVRLTLDPDSPDVTVNADDERLLQVFANLLSNAVYCSREGQEVSVSAVLEKNRVRIFVTDHGPGIPSEFQTQVFEKFSHADMPGRRNRGGTGLGLSIAKAIVEQHGGSIGFDTEIGKGTTFHFDLPLHHKSAVPACW